MHHFSIPLLYISWGRPMITLQQHGSLWRAVSSHAVFTARSQLQAVYSENIKRKINIPLLVRIIFALSLNVGPRSGWMRCRAEFILSSICYLDTALDTTSGWVREVFMAPEPGGDDCSGPLSVFPAEIRSAVRFQSFWLTLKQVEPCWNT